MHLKYATCLLKFIMPKLKKPACNLTMQKVSLEVSLAFFNIQLQE